MKEICLSYESGYLFKAYAIRYFRYKNNKYLIYTLNEKDDRDYIKLYVVKVMKELGTFVTQTVRRPDEWQTMKGLVKRILSEIKKGKLKIITDLSLEEIDKIVIYENRHFLLASDLVKLLASSPVKEEKIDVQPTIEVMPVPVEEKMPAEQVQPAVVVPQQIEVTTVEENKVEENIEVVPVPLEAMTPVSEVANVDVETPQSTEVTPVLVETIVEPQLDNIQVQSILPLEVIPTVEEIPVEQTTIKEESIVALPIEELIFDSNETTIPETEILELHNALDINPDETEILELDDDEIMELDFESDEILDLEDEISEEVLELSEDEEVEVLES